MPLAHLGDPFKLNGCVTNEIQPLPEDMVLDEEYTDHENSKQENHSNGTVAEIEVKNVTKEGHPKGDPCHFSLIKVLGQGSFGKVFLVRKVCGPDVNTLYAMKVLKKASLKVRDRVRTKYERDILVDVRHPFIVKLHYAFQTEGKLYLILDYLRCGDLFSRLSKEVMFTEEDSKFYLAELVLALEHLHSLGIIYRDLKPENILLGEDGHICLTDFGLCKESLNNEKAFSFCGTVEYMAPEVVNRKGHTTAADWWSFGVLMYEMLTGQLPFRSSNRKETMNQILKARLQMPFYLSEPAQGLLRCLFKRNPDNRLATGPELRQHWFFSTIDFVKLYRKEVKPPFIPTVPLNETFSRDIIEDSPGVPPSATAHELFKGFSYIETNLFDDNDITALPKICSRVELQLCKSSFSKEYKTLGVIGMGAFSICKKCVHISTGKVYAVKEINKQTIEKSGCLDCTEEIEILFRYGKHPNIVTLYEVFEDEKTIYLVMELLNGGELLDRIHKQSYTERDVSAILEVIARTVCYLHENGVVHRDLKPANIMYANESPQSLRICDFGFAKQMKAENGLLMTPCYTTNFAAPEVLKKKGYDETCDIWSMGAVLCMMLTGYTPFASGPADDRNNILGRIEKGTITMSTGSWKNISFIAKDLVKRMLITNPKDRFNAFNVLNHDFIRNRHLLPNTRLKLADITVVKDGAKITYEAKNIELKTAINLLPVETSELAQRRRMKRNPS